MPPKICGGREEERISERRVVSSEISGNFPGKIGGNFRKFIPIFPEISGNFLKSFFLCQSAISKSSDAVK